MKKVMSAIISSALILTMLTVCLFGGYALAEDQPVSEPETSESTISARASSSDIQTSEYESTVSTTPVSTEISSSIQIEQTSSSVPVSTEAKTSVVYKWDDKTVRGDIWKTEGVYYNVWSDGIKPIPTSDEQGNLKISFDKSHLTDEYAKCAQLNLDCNTPNMPYEAGRKYYMNITNNTNNSWKVLVNWCVDGDAQILPPNKTTKISILKPENSLISESGTVKQIHLMIQTTTWPSSKLSPDFMSFSPVYVEGEPIITTSAPTTVAASTVTEPVTTEAVKKSVVYKWNDKNIKGDTWKSEGVYYGTWCDGAKPNAKTDGEGVLDLWFSENQLEDDYVNCAQLNLDCKTPNMPYDAERTYYVDITNHSNSPWKVLVNWCDESETQVIAPNKTTKIEVIYPEKNLDSATGTVNFIHFMIQTTTWPSGKLSPDFVTISPVYVEGEPIVTTSAVSSSTTTTSTVTSINVTTVTTAAVTTSTATTSTVPVTTDLPFIYGDVNGDGKITANDVLLIRKHIAGQSVEINLKAADVNCDSKTTANDVLLIRKYIAGQNIVFG